QIEFLQSLAAPAPVVYVKPHGALYNRIVDDDEHARAVVDALDGLPLLGLPGSRSLALAADRHIRVYREGFADRRYTPAGTLTPRDQPGAVLDDADEVAAQAVELLDLDVDSICVHSDTPGAEHLVRRVRQALLEAGAQLGAFGSWCCAAAMVRCWSTVPLWTTHAGGTRRWQTPTSRCSVPGRGCCAVRRPSCAGWCRRPRRTERRHSAIGWCA